MKWFISVCVCLFALHLVKAAEEKKEEKKVKRLQIGVKKRVDPEKCKVKSKKGDVLKMHYSVRIFFFLSSQDRAFSEKHFTLSL